MWLGAYRRTHTVHTCTHSTYSHSHTYVHTCTYTSAKLPLHPMTPTPFYAQLPAKKSGALIRVINLETATFALSQQPKQHLKTLRAATGRSEIKPLGFVHAKVRTRPLHCSSKTGMYCTVADDATIENYITFLCSSLHTIHNEIHGVGLEVCQLSPHQSPHCSTQ